MRRAVWYPSLMDRNASVTAERDRERGMLERAAARKQAVLAKADYEIDGAGAREIERILAHAQEALTG